jgi:hypothetical protein
MPSDEPTRTAPSAYGPAAAETNLDAGLLVQNRLRGLARHVTELGARPTSRSNDSLTNLLAVLHHTLLGRLRRRPRCSCRRWGRSAVRHGRRRLPTDRRGRRRAVDDRWCGSWPVDGRRWSRRLRRRPIHDLLRRRGRRVFRGRRRTRWTNRWPRWCHAWSLRQGSGRRSGPRRCSLHRRAWPDGGWPTTGTRQARRRRAVWCRGW